MKHVKSVTRQSGPARAYIFDWLVNWTAIVPWKWTPGLQNTQKGTYANILWGLPDSFDPSDENDSNLFAS
jgi:hypothetical protein